MTKQEAVDIMKTSTNIAEWNNNREVVKSKCTNEEWNTLYWHIDALGLSVEVLEKDSEEYIRARNK